MMVKKKKKQSRSESSTPKKTLDSKLANGKDSKHMIRGLSSKPAQGLSSQSRVVRCPKCHKFLQEPLDVTIYKCSGCNSILLAKRWDNDMDLLSSQNRSLSTEVESAQDSGSKTPVRSSYRKYSSRASPCSETAYMRRHETSYIRREWMTKSNVSDAFASARSCSGVVTKKEDTTTLLDLLRFSDSGTRFAEETDVVIHHQDSASDSHLSSSDKGSGDGICISNDAVILKRNLETFEDKGIKEDMIRSKFYDLKLEAFQPSLNHKLREQQPEEESAEGGGSKTPVRSSYRKYSSRASPLFETSYRRRHETTTYIRREWMRSASPSPSSYGYTSSPFHGSEVSASEKSYHHQPNQFKQYGREGWFQESSSSSAASPIRFQGETSEQKCYNWSSQQSQMLHESSSWSGVLELSSITKKEEGDVTRRSESSEFYELKPEAFQPHWNHHKSSEATGETSRIYLEQAHSVEPLNKNDHVWETNLLSEKYTRDMQEFDLGELKWEDITGDKGDSICDISSSNGEMYEEDTKHISNQSFIGNPDQSGKATVTTYMIHEERSKDDEYENISERQELDKNISDRVRYELEDARLETVYAGVRRWEETVEDRAGLHLEEYETNYELGTLLEPDNGEADDGSSESSSTGSFNSHECSKLRAVFHQEEEPQVVMSGSRTEMISVKLEDIFEWTSERAPTFHLYEPELGEDSRLVNDEDEPWLVDAYETKALKVIEDGASLDLEKFENENLLLDQSREDMFRLSLDDTLEQERIPLEMSQDKEVNLRQTFKQGDTEENILASGSVLTSEVVGLRHALYQTQTSPPLSSPVHTPIGSSSPLHIRMRSSMNSHIVSPLRSPPTNSSGSLSDVLFLAKKT